MSNLVFTLPSQKPQAETLELVNTCFAQCIFSTRLEDFKCRFACPCWSSNSFSVLQILPCNCNVNVFKHECPSNVWLSAQFNFIFHERKNQILFTSNSSKRVGLNSLSNRFNFVCHMLEFDWLSLSLDAMKVRCKRIFLK